MTTPQKVLEKLRKIYPNEENLKITQSGANWNEADQLARETCKSNPKAKYINPFDDPLLWEGHSSLVQEMKEQLEHRNPDLTPDLIVCSVGGGGLYNGIRLGLRKAYGEKPGNKIPVLAIETIGCDSLNLAVKNKQKGYKLPAITSKATSLGSLIASNQSYEEYFSTNSFSSTVTDQECFSCMKEFAINERVLIEPACAASVAAVDTEEKLRKVCENWESEIGKVEFDEIKTVVIEVCGGNLVDAYYDL